MALTLYGIAVSSYVAKVRLALRLKGLAFTEVPPPGGYGSAEYRAIVTAGSVPAIVHDGFALHESEAILEYIEDRWPVPSLRPVDLKARAWHRAIALYHDTKLEPAVRATFGFVANPPATDVLEAARRTYEERLDKLAELVDPAPFLGSKTIALGECGYPTTLMMGARLFEALGAPVREPAKIVAWRAAFAAHPLVAANTAYCQAALDAWITEKQQQK